MQEKHIALSRLVAADASGLDFASQGIELPKVDFEELLREQLAIAKQLKNRAVALQSFSERLLNFIEGPWAPAAQDLPDRRCPVESGNLRDPFRRQPGSPSEFAARRKLLRQVCQSEKATKLSAWTTAFEYQVPIRHLPEGARSFTVLHLSDIHLLKGVERSSLELARIARFVESGSHTFDLAVISGDLITRSPEDLCRSGLHSLQRISKACSLAFSVHGNHDYHGHVPALISRELERVGFHDLNNQKASVSLGGTSLNLVGVDDAYFGRPQAPAKLSESEINIVLTHNLDAVRANFPPSVDLILSGHTHWGEARLLDGALLMKMWGYSDNVNRHTKHWDMLSERTLSYVHPGLARYYVPYRGIWHPPGIAIHTLVPAQNS